MKKINCPIFTPTAPKKEQAVKEWLTQLESEIQAYWEKTESKKCYNVLKKYSKYLKTLYNEEIYKGNVKEEIDAYFNTINNKKRLIALSGDDPSYPAMCSTPSSLSQDQQKLCSALFAINIPIFQTAAQARIDALDTTTDKGKALVSMLQDLLTYYSGKTTGFTNTDFCNTVCGGKCSSTTNTLPSKFATTNSFLTILQTEIGNLTIKYSIFTPAKSGGIENYASDPGVQIFSFQKNFFNIAKAVEDAISPTPDPTDFPVRCAYSGTPISGDKTTTPTSCALITGAKIKVCATPHYEDQVLTKKRCATQRCGLITRWGTGEKDEDAMKISNFEKWEENSGTFIRHGWSSWDALTASTVGDCCGTCLQLTNRNGRIAYVTVIDDQDRTGSDSDHSNMDLDYLTFSYLCDPSLDACKTGSTLSPSQVEQPSGGISLSIKVVSYTNCTGNKGGTHCVVQGGVCTFDRSTSDTVTKSMRDNGACPGGAAYCAAPTSSESTEE